MNIDTITPIEFEFIKPIETRLSRTAIVDLYRNKNISRDEYLGLMVYKKESLFDINYYLNNFDIVVTVKETPSDTTGDYLREKYTDRVIHILKHTKSLNKRLTVNILRQQTAWLKDDCESMLNSMVENGSITRDVVVVNGKEVTYYDYPTIQWEI